MAGVRNRTEEEWGRRELFRVGREGAMEHEKVLTTIVGENKTSRLEVALGPDVQGGRTIELRHLSWGDGVGWYCQQTLRLEPREAEELLWTLKGSRRKWRDQPFRGTGKIIAFPLQQTNQQSQDAPRLYDAQKRRPSRPSPASSGTGKTKTKQKDAQSAISRA